VRLGEVTARIDEAYVHLRFPAGGATKVTIGFDTVGGAAAAAPGAAAARADAAFVLDLSARTGESWIRADLDPVPLDYDGPAPSQRDGWLRYRLNTNRDLVVPSTGERLPAEFVDVGCCGTGTGIRTSAAPTAGAVVPGRLRRRRAGAVGAGRVRRSLVEAGVGAEGPRAVDGRGDGPRPGDLAGRR
jgi:hypothetical protein